MTITGKVLRDAIISGANNISRQRQAVDELNVFPVPDGDTGTNMSMTIKNATAELKNASIGAGAGDIAKIAASAMLRGARGNSLAYFQGTFKRSGGKGNGGRGGAFGGVQAGCGRGLQIRYEAHGGHYPHCGERGI